MSRIPGDLFLAVALLALFHPAHSTTTQDEPTTTIDWEQQMNDFIEPPVPASLMPTPGPDCPLMDTIIIGRVQGVESTHYAMSSMWVEFRTEHTSQMFGGPRTEQTIVSFVTLLVEPTPTDAAYPRDVVTTMLTDIYHTRAKTFTSKCPETTTYTTIGVAHYHTYRAYPSETSYMAPSFTEPADVPCTGSEDEFEPEDECLDMGMDTACAGQCEEVKGELKCRKPVMWDLPSSTTNHMGRVCWWANNTIIPLWKPCLEGDHWVGCMPGEGPVEDFYMLNWRPARWAEEEEEEKNEEDDKEDEEEEP